MSKFTRNSTDKKTYNSDEIIPLICATCGNQLVTTKITAIRRFCSQACARTYWWRLKMHKGHKNKHNQEMRDAKWDKSKRHDEDRLIFNSPFRRRPTT